MLTGYCQDLIPELVELSRSDLSDVEGLAQFGKPGLQPRDAVGRGLESLPCRCSRLAGSLLGLPEAGFKLRGVSPDDQNRIAQILRHAASALL